MAARIVAHPDVGTSINGEYLVYNAAVVYDLGALGNRFGRRPSPGATGLTVRRCYCCRLCTAGLFSSRRLRKQTGRRIDRDLAKLARQEISVVDDDGKPFSPDLVTSLISW
jgi:hypothetical protein